MYIYVYIICIYIYLYLYMYILEKDAYNLHTNIHLLKTF